MSHAPMNFLLPISSLTLRDFCERNGISRLSVFGSRQKGSAHFDSDIDILVEFHQDRTPGFLGMA
jgi:hypothetical protein